MKRFLIILVIIILFPLTCYGADDEYNSFLNSFDLSFMNELDSDTYSYLDELGLDTFDYDAITSISLQAVINHIFDLLATKLSSPLKSMVLIMAITILSAIINSFSESVNSSNINSIYKTVSSIIIAIILVVNITDCIILASSSIMICSNFAFAFFPSFCVIIASFGNAGTSISANTMLLTLAQAMNYIANNVFIPAVNCFLALGICSSLSSELNISSIIKILKDLIIKAISLITAIFVSILSIKTSVSARADVLGIRSIRFAINTIVPVIGGSISEGLLSIQSYSSLIKSSVGIVGITSIFLIFLPSIIEVNCWRISLSASIALAKGMSNDSACGVLEAFNSTLLIIDVILIFCMVTTIISLGILVAAKSVV